MNGIAGMNDDIASGPSAVASTSDTISVSEGAGEGGRASDGEGGGEGKEPALTRYANDMLSMLRAHMKDAHALIHAAGATR